MDLRNLLLAAAALTPLAGPAFGADLWGLAGEKPASFRAKVVDLLCEVSGDCAPACGAGRRQLGLLTEDGKLRAAVKGAFEFAGAAADLAPYCGRTIEVDGLLVENPAMTLYFVQAIRERSDEAWRPTEAFRGAWQARNGDPADWVRKDPDVKAIIAEKGVFGVPGLKSTSPDVIDPSLKAAK
jgi:hypothetical protein